MNHGQRGSEGFAVDPFTISVCSLGELPEFCDRHVTHLLSIWNSPQYRPTTPVWISPENRFDFNFDDVEFDSEEYTAPTRADVQRAIAIGQVLIAQSAASPVHLLIHCYAGISRSAAMALAILMVLYGNGGEERAVRHLLEIRPCAWPNPRIVLEADLLLGCGGELVQAVAVLISEGEHHLTPSQSLAAAG